MISSIEITCNAAHPEMPLTPFVAFKTSPSSVRVMGVPKRIGNWVIDSVFLKVLYPDNSYSTRTCVRNGNVWVGTLDGTDTTGTVANGFMIGANGVDENGDEVSGYILGVGDVKILDADGSFHPDVQSHAVRILDGMPENPNVGDAYFDDGALMIRTNSGWSKTLLKVSQVSNDANYWSNGRDSLYVEDEERGTTQINGNSVYIQGGMVPPNLNVVGYGATATVLDNSGNGVTITTTGIDINSSPVTTLDYINSNIKNLIGGYLRPGGQSAFQTYAQLVETTNQAKQHPTYSYFYDGNKYKNPNHNDQVMVAADETHDNRTTVYRWVGAFPGVTGQVWQYLYTVNGDKLTTAQWAVLDGGPYAKSSDIKDSTITFTQGGVSKGSFTLNQATGATIALDAGGGGSSKCLMNVSFIGGSSQYVSWTSGNDTFKVMRTYNGKLKLLKNEVEETGYYGIEPIIADVDGNVSIYDNGYSNESNVVLDNARQSSYFPLNTTGKKTLNIRMDECLEQSTPITMADGTTKPICELKIGDKVLSLNPDTLKIEEDEVVDCDGGIMKMHNRMDVWTFADGTTINTIKPHQFFNTRTGKMEYMADFMIGDGVRKQDGTTTALTGHETKYGVYFHNTLYTKKFNNYFANGILSGNRKSVKWGWLWKQENA